MDRRTDRAIAIGAITAVAVVPTAILVAVKTGAAAPKEPGAMPPAAAAAQRDPAGTEKRSPSASPAPASSAGSASPAGGRGGTAPGRKAGTGGKDGTAAPGEPPAEAPKVTSFVRRTDVRLSGASNGDYEHQKETATYTLAPRFALNATGVRETMKDGRLTRVTQKVIVKGRTLSGYDGKSWTHSTLTAAQVDRLRTSSDPRQLTYLLRALPGMTRTGPDRLGSTHYLASARLGDLYRVLPEDVAARAREVLPDATRVALDLWADGADRPSWIGLNGSAPGTMLAGSMTFRSYR
ncbi:hypothetical protein GCM10023085_54220 [Actinomadura viridis]|uniref:Uncharacterized protein n=1 Tax=Actinomadura viridis TaxID=58110 RepID=A0A931DA34_9ACTN|nr:hypothetical protein [Actinomadura viridis]MBG6086380.1 hypothetical protein [Actinomadura viridis]